MIYVAFAMLFAAAARAVTLDDLRNTVICQAQVTSQGFPIIRQKGETFLEACERNPECDDKCVDRTERWLNCLDQFGKGPEEIGVGETPNQACLRVSQACRRSGRCAPRDSPRFFGGNGRAVAAATEGGLAGFQTAAAAGGALLLAALGLYQLHAKCASEPAGADEREMLA